MKKGLFLLVAVSGMLFLFATFKKESSPTPAQKIKSKPSSKFAFKKQTPLNANKTKVFKAEAKRNIQNAPKLNTLKKTETQAQTETEVQPESLQTGSGALLNYAIKNYLKENKEIYLNTIDELLEKGVDVNEEDKHGFLPFQLISLIGNTDLIQKFLDHGADVNAKNKFGGTALELAISNGNFEAVKLIINNGGVIETPLIPAIASDNLDIAEFLIKEVGADVNEPDHINDITPLIAAAALSPKAVKFLIDYGADVNLKSKAGQTPLMLAAMFGNLEVIKTLLNHGADLNTKDGKNFTALYYAMETDNTDVIKFLIKKGAE